MLKKHYFSFDYTTACLNDINGMKGIVKMLCLHDPESINNNKILFIEEFYNGYIIVSVFKFSTG